MMQDRREQKQKRTARHLTLVCGVLFFVFSFVYLFILQSDVIEALHQLLSGGKTRFSAFWSASLISVALLLLRWGVNALMGLKGAVRTFSYFPSFLLLGVMTDVGYNLHEKGIAGCWAWLLPLLLLVYLLVVYALRRLFRSWLNAEMESSMMVIGNLTLFLGMMLMTMCIGNTDIHLHHELAIAKSIRKGDYAEARRIGAKVNDPNRTLTALRAYAMSKEGTLGEYLFQYPQPYGVSGLLIDATDGATLPSSADSLYAYLGAVPHQGEHPVDFFRRLCSDETEGFVAQDYYLSALLLDKRLDAFVAVFKGTEMASDTLPRYYREALFLYGKLHPSLGVELKDEAMEAQWQAYEALQKEWAGTVGEGNRLRRKFGDTYWWYYLNSNNSVDR